MLFTSRYIILSFSLPIYLSIYLSISLSIYLSQVLISNPTWYFLARNWRLDVIQPIINLSLSSDQSECEDYII